MSKRSAVVELTVINNYKLADLPPLERGKYSALLKDDSNVVMIDPDIRECFPNEEAVNSALRSLSEIAKRAKSQAER